jgi:hypothetical protein
MAANPLKSPAPPTVWTWILVSLLWGTVFFGTSTFMLVQAVALLQTGIFDPVRSEVFQVYGFFILVLLAVALGSMAVKNLFDPGYASQVRRKKDISEGKGERLFISFAGSIATSFTFTILTALTYTFTTTVTGASVAFKIPVVLVAAGLNIAAGLAASLLVGIIFIMAKVGKR